MSNKSQKFVGEVHLLGEVEEKYNNKFQLVVLKEDVSGKTNYASFTASNGIHVHLEPLKEKDIVEIEYNINGKEYNNKFYNNLLVTHVNLVKKFVPTLFSPDDIELPEAKEADELFDWKGND